MKPMEKLFKEWRKRHDVVKDGIVDAGRYACEGTKVLYILREVNGGGNWDLRELLRDHTHPYGDTWKNISRWQYGIEHAGDKASWNVADDTIADKRILRHIAAINLRKDDGAGSADMNVIRRYAQHDQDLLRQQIKLCNPDVIVCCGTGDIVKELQLAGQLGKWKMRSFEWDGYQRGIDVGYVVTDKYIVIKMRHPNRAPRCSFRALATMYKQARKEKLKQIA
jgi:hypothetical protein